VVHRWRSTRGARNPRAAGETRAREMEYLRIMSTDLDGLTCKIPSGGRATRVSTNTGGEFNPDRKAASDDAMEGRQPAPRRSATPPARPRDTMPHRRPGLLPHIAYWLAHITKVWRRLVPYSGGIYTSTRHPSSPFGPPQVRIGSHLALIVTKAG
jgi:hypothetical protein